MRKETIFSILIISLLLLSTNIFDSEESYELDEGVYTNLAENTGNSGSDIHINWLNSWFSNDHNGFDFEISGSLLQTDPATGDLSMNSESELISSNGVGVKVTAFGTSHNTYYDVQVQLWGLHKDPDTGSFTKIRHGFEKSSSDNLTNSESIDFGEILFFSIDSNDGTVYPRRDGCYWFEAKISLESAPNREQYLVIESEKIDFSPNGSTSCPNQSTQSNNFDSDDDGWADYYENLTDDTLIWYDSETSPISDDDNDGVPDYRDICPLTLLNSYVDPTGCAYSDDDNDGVPDHIDMCLSTRPVTNSFVNRSGCTYLDGDNDGVPDHIDMCPETKEKLFVDSSGCVDLDNDNDGIPNSRDQCSDTNSTDYVGPDGCRIDNHSVTLVENKCDSSKMFDCTSPLVLISGGLVGGVATNATINRLRRPKKPETSKSDESNNESSNPEQDKEPTDGNTEENRESNKEDDENRKSKKRDDEKSECSIPIFILEDAICGEQYSCDLTSLVDGYEPTDKFVAENIGSGNWASVSSSGIISGLPEIKDSDLTKILVRVTNSKGLWADVEIRINLRKNSSGVNNPPKWINS